MNPTQLRRQAMYVPSAALILIGSILSASTAGATEEVDQLKRQVEQLQQKVDAVTDVHSEWREAQSVVHLAGYGAVGYTDVEDEDGSFDNVNVNPIFHYQYKDLFLLEMELEIAVAENGETETELEYGAIDWFANDHMVVQTGKFLSPIGQFRQNIHPAWINKFASAPPGFGHDGAAPVSDVGAQLRGGAMLGGNSHLNYAVYVGNGPRPEIDAGEIHGLEAEGATSNEDGEMVYGGRVGVLPVPSLEIGVSAATGDVGPEGEETLLRDYSVYGADFSWHPTSSLEVRGEYVQSEIGANAASAAPESAKWSSWYVQGAYRFLPTQWEAVLRYSDFDSPHADDDQEQSAVGVNYWFAPNAVAKLGYEANDGQTGASSDDDRWLLQLAYGF